MKVTHDGRRITVEVTADGDGLLSHAGSALLSQVADKSGLTKGLSRELSGLQLRAGSHDRGRVIRDLAVMLADGGDCLADIGALGDQAVCRRCRVDVDGVSGNRSDRQRPQMAWSACAPRTLVPARVCGSSRAPPSG